MNSLLWPLVVFCFASGPAVFVWAIFRDTRWPTRVEPHWIFLVPVNLAILATTFFPLFVLVSLVVWALR